MSSGLSPDAIVIGSGMGGLSCAAALAKTGHRVTVVEQHHTAGGLTQTFARHGFRWDVGVHYLGEVGPKGPLQPLLDWLSDGAIRFASLGEIYDVAHFPDGIALAIPRTEAAYRQALVDIFPDAGAEIDAVLAAMAEAQALGPSLFAQRAMPHLLAKLVGLRHARDIRKYWGRSSAEVLATLVNDPRLRAVFLAQKDNYGGVPAREISFGLEAMVTRHYFDGAYYPIGGARSFARGLIPVIEAAGGKVRLNAKVDRLLMQGESAAGVRLADGSDLRAGAVFSAIGAPGTVRLLPEALQRSAWAEEIVSFRPSVTHVALYLGFEGDALANGATRANQWFRSTWDIDESVWNPETDAEPPGLFISFPSLKDPDHDPGPHQRHTAEVVAPVAWTPFARWQDSTLGERPEGYSAFKTDLETRLMAGFARRFPDLAPLVVARELSTPLTNAAYIGSAQGAMYGIEVSPRRFTSDALRPKTPVPGLYLAGQDVVSPGVTGTMIGGVLAASTYDRKVRAHLS